MHLLCQKDQKIDYHNLRISELAGIRLKVFDFGIAVYAFVHFNRCPEPKIKVKMLNMNNLN
jgi:hypothetical protein